MDMSKWAFSPDGPQWPVEEDGEKVKAVRLMDTFDSADDSDMKISLLAAYGIPCFKYYIFAFTLYFSTKISIRKAYYSKY